MPEPNVLEEFIIKIGLDPSDYKKESAEFQRNLNRDRQGALRAGRQLEDSSKRQREGWRSVKGEILGLVATLGGAAGLKAFVETTVKGDAALARTSRTLGLNARELAAWSGALKGAGGSAQDAANDLQILVGASQDLKLTGQSSLIPLMQLIGLTAKDLENPTEALLKISDRLSRMDPVQGANIAQRFGFSPAMVTTLLKGKDATRALLEEQRRLSNVTDEGTKSAEELTRALGGLETASTSLGRSLLTKLVPGLTAVVKGLTDVVSGRDDAVDFIQKLLGTHPSQRPQRRGRPGRRGGSGTPQGQGTAALTLRPGGGGLTTVPASSMAQARFQQAVAYFRSKGWSQAAAEGMAAGIWAESRFDSSIKSPLSTAYGIGQWTKSSGRQDDFRRVMGRDLQGSSFEQQLDFLQWELNNTERGAGKSIYDAATSTDALNAYVVKFMRPKKGSETTGDLARGGRALAQWGGGNITVDVGGVTVVTQGSDGRAVASSVAQALRPAVAQAVKGLQ